MSQAPPEYEEAVKDVEALPEVIGVSESKEAPQGKSAGTVFWIDAAMENNSLILDACKQLKPPVAVKLFNTAQDAIAVLRADSDSQDRGQGHKVRTRTFLLCSRYTRCWPSRR